MKKASPLDIRNALILTDNLKKAGLDFVPIPVKSPEHKAELIMQFNKAIEEIEEMVSED